MMDDIEKTVKEKLLESLIDEMSGHMGDRMKPKGLAVQVAAPDKERLAEGLDKAKGVLGSMPEGAGESEPESDEERLRELLEGEDDDDKPMRG